MVANLKLCFLCVPTNSQGILEHEEFPDEYKNIRTIELTEIEVRLLRSVFVEWNRRFNMLISIYEDETLEGDNVIEALEILKKHKSLRSSKDTDYMTAAAKLEVALKLAIKYKTCVFMDF